MGTLGDELKAAREARKLTIRELADRTRISYSFLQALEEGDYSAIPGEVFVTGFLRTYARELGLDEKRVMALYRESREPTVELQLSQSEPEPALAQPPIKAVRKWFVFVAVGVVLLAAAAFWLLGRTKPEGPADTSARQVKQPVPVAAAKPYGNMTTVVPPTPQTTPPSKDATAAETGPIGIKLTADGPAWYSYRADDGNWTSGLLHKGESIDIAAHTQVILNLGNAGGTKVVLNGKPLLPFGKAGDVIKNIVFRQGGEVKVPLPEKPPASRPLHGTTSIMGR